MWQQKKKQAIKCLERNKKVFSKCFASTLFLGCLIYVTYQGYQCVKKFSERPQSVEVSYQNFSHFSLPSFTFCPKLEAEVYDLQVLRDCNLTIDNYLFDGPWVGPNENCSNPKELYLRLIPSVDDLLKEFLEDVVLFTFSRNVYSLKSNSSLVKWSKTNYFQYPCHTMTLSIVIVIIMLVMYALLPKLQLYLQSCSA